jgi:hypothetical protein
MRIAILAIVAGAAVLAVPSAFAAKAPPPSLVWAPTVEVGYTETVRDAAGAIVSQTHHDGIRPGALFGTAGASILGSGFGHATSLDPGSNLALAPDKAVRGLAACCSSGGSDTVEYTVTQRTTLFGLVAWRYRQTVHWCWSYPRITCLSIGAGFYDVDGSSSSVNSGNDGYGWYYAWAGSDTGGHFSHRQGSVSNCIFRVGCIGTSYPSVDMWINGNGAWTASGSTN